MDLSPLDKLAREVRRASDEMATPGPTVEAAKRRALEGFQKRRAPARRPVALVLVAAALCAALFLLFPRRPAVTYVMGPSAEPGQLGAWIAAGAEGMPLRFSEGTVMTLASGTRARVTRADADGAAILIERGATHARVVHASPSTRWDVQAGPFEIAVVGTEFDVAWDPAREVLDLRMVEGKVLVKGPLLGEGRALTQGEALRVDVQAQRSEVRVTTAQNEEHQEAAAPAEHAIEAPEIPPAPPPAAHDDDPKPASSATPAASADKREALPAWRALAAEGRHREAMEAVEKEGFEHILASAPAPVLLELADEARFAGQHARAREALLRARSLGARGRSAFLLGKLAADHQNAPAEAVSWFERYLNESPEGGLAEQALGRLIELKKRIGDTAGARASAELYLRRHPGGAYAALARVTAAP
jgi:hypothetical protein